MFSRSGREVKPKQYEIPVDDEPAKLDSQYEVKMLSSFKRKRGRPPKHLKVIKEKSKKLLTESYHLENGITPKDSKDSTETIKNNSGPELPAVECLKVTKSQNESKALVVTAKENFIAECATETSANIELDSGSSNDVLEVDGFGQSAAINDISNESFSPDDNNIKVLEKKEEDKVASSKMEVLPEVKSSSKLRFKCNLEMSL